HAAVQADAAPDVLGDEHGLAGAVLPERDLVPGLAVAALREVAVVPADDTEDGVGVARLVPGGHVILALGAELLDVGPGGARDRGAAGGVGPAALAAAGLGVDAGHRLQGRPLHVGLTGEVPDETVGHDQRRVGVVLVDGVEGVHQADLAEHLLPATAA